MVPENIIALHEKAGDLLESDDFENARKNYLLVIDYIESQTQPTDEVLFLRDNCYYRVWDSFVGSGKAIDGVNFFVKRPFKYPTGDIKNLLLNMGHDLVERDDYSNARPILNRTVSKEFFNISAVSGESRNEALAMYDLALCYIHHEPRDFVKATICFYLSHIFDPSLEDPKQKMVMAAKLEPNAGNNLLIYQALDILKENPTHRESIDKLSHAIDNILLNWNATILKVSDKDVPNVDNWIFNANKGYDYLRDRHFFQSFSHFENAVNIASKPFLCHGMGFALLKLSRINNNSYEFQKGLTELRLVREAVPVYNFSMFIKVHKA